VTRLLNEDTARDARRELSLMGPAVAPSIVMALQDQRFHRAVWGRGKFTEAPPPLESALQLLAEHAADDLLSVAPGLVGSPSKEVRKTTALHLSSAGHTAAMPLLRTLLQDDDGYVRSYVCIGVNRAVAAGRADAEYRKEAYDLLLAQCDQDWAGTMNSAAKTVVGLDRERAAVDLADERWLNPANLQVHQLLDACNAANIHLPEAGVRPLLEAALPRAVGDRCWPNQSVAAAALLALALRGADGTGALAESLLDHEQEPIKKAAANALAALAGVTNPTGFVIDRMNASGYEALSHAQRVVYCACIYDGEVCNGGLMQFFGNSSGQHAVDTLEALSELGHAEAHAALATAISLVGPLAVEPDREARLAGFEGRWEELRPAFEPLEQAYYQTNVKLTQAWLLYASRHPEDFRA